jgi:hypothetical protein
MQSQGSALAFCFAHPLRKAELSTRQRKTKRPTLRVGLLHVFAERTLLSSNLKPLNELETSRLEKSHFTTQNSGAERRALADVFLRDLAAINEFLFYVESEPFVTPEKAENHKRVAFKKVQAA